MLLVFRAHGVLLELAPKLGVSSAFLLFLGCASFVLQFCFAVFAVLLHSVLCLRHHWPGATSTSSLADHRVVRNKCTEYALSLYQPRYLAVMDDVRWPGFVVQAGRQGQIGSLSWGHQPYCLYAVQFGHYVSFVSINRTWVFGFCKHFVLSILRFLRGKARPWRSAVKLFGYWHGENWASCSLSLWAQDSRVWEH